MSLHSFRCNEMSLTLEWGKGMLFSSIAAALGAASIILCLSLPCEMSCQELLLLDEMRLRNKRKGKTHNRRNRQTNIRIFLAVNRLLLTYKPTNESWIHH
jgi:hypothetical protein